MRPALWLGLLVLAGNLALPGLAQVPAPPEAAASPAGPGAQTASARSVGLSVQSGTTHETLVDARADAARGTSRDRAVLDHARLGTSTVESVIAEAHASSADGAFALAEGRNVSLLDGLLTIESVRLTATSSMGQGEGRVTFTRVRMQGATYNDMALVSLTVPFPGGRAILGEAVPVPGGFRVSAARIVHDSGVEVFVLTATALTAPSGPAPPPPLPPMPSRASAAATRVEAVGGYRALDDANTSAVGLAGATARVVDGAVEVASTGTQSEARAEVVIPNVALLGGLVVARDLRATADVAADDTVASAAGFARVGELEVDGKVVAPVPQDYLLVIPGVGEVHANEVRLTRTEDPDTSTTLATAEAVALRVVLYDMGQGVGEETSVGRVRAEAFAPRTPRVALSLQEYGTPVKAGDVVTFLFHATSTGTASLTQGVVVDSALGAVCEYRILRPGRAIPCERLEVVTADLAHHATTSAVDFWGAPAAAHASGFIDVEGS